MLPTDHDVDRGGGKRAVRAAPVATSVHLSLRLSAMIPGFDWIGMLFSVHRGPPLRLFAEDRSVPSWTGGGEDLLIRGYNKLPESRTVSTQEATSEEPSQMRGRFFFAEREELPPHRRLYSDEDIEAYFESEGFRKIEPQLLSGRANKEHGHRKGSLGAGGGGGHRWTSAESLFSEDLVPLRRGLPNAAERALEIAFSPALALPKWKELAFASSELSEEGAFHRKLMCEGGNTSDEVSNLLKNTNAGLAWDGSSAAVHRDLTRSKGVARPPFAEKAATGALSSGQSSSSSFGPFLAASRRGPTE
ncbi:hypothetical protein HPB47_003956 [Ixodes persulcatus]|uniref:Uncharacterized protein n=1 Tax=Ixodes persulcatus TaxID=34615 RepID=A0AC60PH21_IXOPE|nr:hypothetical protein HPB47_003956 [Ixodes persulcatus]